tara:strand:+ start:17255 stop:17752 length:498 start_codon:yes stop_codon:yes gene_type:complete
MTEEEEIIFTEEEQSYNDHLKRIGNKISERIGDEFKRINFIESYYPNFNGAVDTFDLSDAFQRVAPVLRESEISRTRLENTIKTLKFILYSLRQGLNQFEEEEGIHYEFGLAQLLARKGNIRPEQIAPIDLKHLPDIGSIGGKKRKSKTKKHKKKHKKTKKHKKH